VSVEGGYLSEPQLIFGDGKTFIDPKVGLQLYGPLKAEGAKTTAPTSIKVGIIGTGETVSQANRWLDRIDDRVVPGDVDPIQSPSFPGFRHVFSCDLVRSEEFNDLISEAELQQIRRFPTFEDRVEKAVDLFVEGLQNVSSGSFRPDIVICALPDDVVNYCVVKRGILGRTKGKLPGELRELIDKLRDYKRVHQTFLDTGFQEEADRIINATFPETTNFWRNLKAEAMRIPMPTQIMWPDTLARHGLTRQDDASVAWNTSVGLYYKGSGFPWTMTKMQVGTCYVGISFFRNPTDKEGRLRTSLAQIFTYTGEGLVLRGESFDWDTTLDNTPHLTEAGARDLLVAALSLYDKRLHSQPGRVVLHKSSNYWPDEKRGLLAALKGIPIHDFVSFGDKSIKFFRFGKYPPLRGTVIKIDKGNYLLYSRGYIPYTQTYPGARVPWPLDITHEGDSPADTILSEILALTKMNWNSAEFSISQPITMVFSDRVGEVMSSIPTSAEPLHEYRYYM
jgi:hypothetical protein